MLEASSLAFGDLGVPGGTSGPCSPQDWEQAQAGSVLATGPHAFDSDPEISDVDEDDRETLFSSMDVLSPGGHSDAQTLAMMLQEQLDAINEEIR